MSQKMTLPDEILDAVSGGLMTFGHRKVTDCSLNEEGLTLILEDGDKYFRKHSDRDKAIFKSDPGHFKQLFDNAIHNDDVRADAHMGQFTKV